MPHILHPLDEISIEPHIAALPKADIHIHAEWAPRLDRVLARRKGRPGYDWRQWAQNLMTSNPPGNERLKHIGITFNELEPLDQVDENAIQRIQDLLEESAADGAVLCEARFGKDLEQRPNFLDLFHEAERRVQSRYPNFHAEAIPVILMWLEPDRIETMIQRYSQFAKDGKIYGVDFLTSPYHTEADWSNITPIVRRFADAGLAITIHVGEVSSANIEAALKLPGLTRFGHATYAGYDEHLLEQVAASGVTIECSLTCNVVLGVAKSYEAHPLRRFVDWNIPVALCTDDPVRIGTTIGREYQIAHQLGFSESNLLQFTRHAIEAAFTTPQRRKSLLKLLQ